jgi:hypothetical protein
VGLEESVRDFAARVASVASIGYQNTPVAVDGHIASVPTTPAPARPRQRNLLHDTVFRRARARAAAAIHALDDALARRGRGPRRLLFEAASPMSLAVFAPVLRHLRNDPRIELWFTSCDRSWTPEAIFSAAGITERVVPAHEVQWAKFDGYINTDFWDMTWLPRRTKRVHFFHGVAGKYGLDAPVRIAPIVATFDSPDVSEQRSVAALCGSRAHRRRLLAGGPDWLPQGRLPGRRIAESDGHTRACGRRSVRPHCAVRADLVAVLLSEHDGP